MRRSQHHVVAVAGLIGAAIVLCREAPVHARGADAQCKQIRAALAANQTLDQIIKKFDSDAQQVMKCVQARGGKRKASKASTTKSKATTKTKGSHSKQSAPGVNSSASSGAPAGAAKPRAVSPHAVLAAPH